MDKKAILRSHGFIFGLALLLFNDFYLKNQFPNFLTGKLSDLAGLFIFPLFLQLFFPNKKTLYFLTGICFIFWKSEFSQPFINLWNKLPLLPYIDRVVDSTDNFCLAVLPFSYWYSNHYQMVNYKILPKIILPLTIFSLLATSVRPPEINDINREYFFNCKVAELFSGSGQYESNIDDGKRSATVYYSIKEVDSLTILTIKGYQLNYHPFEDDYETKKLNKLAEDKLLEDVKDKRLKYTGVLRLKEDTLDKVYTLLNGVPHGLYQELKPKQILGYYKNGNKDSVWQYYDSTNNYRSEIIYKDGEKISENSDHYDTRDELITKSGIGLAVDIVFAIAILYTYFRYSKKNNLLKEKEENHPFWSRHSLFIFLGILSSIAIPIGAFILYAFVKDGLPKSVYYMGIEPGVTIFPIAMLLLIIFNPVIFTFLYLFGRHDFTKGYSLLFILGLNFMTIVISEHLQFIAALHL